MRRLLLLPIAAMAALVLAQPGEAQLSSLARSGAQSGTVSGDEPVTFNADQVEYDRQNNLVIATGHVEAWQDGHTLYADKVIFDRNTNVAAASGHVVMLQPDGQTVFAEYAELTQGMRDAVLKGMSALMAQNGHMVANGARRSEGKINELSRMVYSTCNACKEDPTRAPLWQIRAYSAVEDTEHERIDYQDAWMDILGIPVAYFPYFWSVDPAAKRGSGFLAPSIGTTSHIGTFATLPYYWVLDDQSDVTLLPTITSQVGPQLEADYRRRFNDGTMSINASTAYEYDQSQYTIFAKGQFDYDDTYRYGFDIERASSADYVRDFRFTGVSTVLTSSVYVEGFGEGAYDRLDARAYQGLTALTTAAPGSIPFVLPRYEYSFFGEPDALGGRTTVDLQTYNVSRQTGTSDQMGGVSVNWERPFQGQIGDLYKIMLRADGLSYNATGMNLVPNFASIANSTGSQGQATAALEMRWPLERNGSGWEGRQLIEPIIQLVGAPNSGGSYAYRVPNEDSQALEFTDANLFSLNRFPGLDREEGGARANVGLHGAWYMGDGSSIDTLVGQVYRARVDDTFPAGSGLDSTFSDVVGRITVLPTSWFSFTARGRFDHRDLTAHYGEFSGDFGNSQLLHFNVGYIYTDTNPFLLYNSAPTTTTVGAVPSSLGTFPRNEVQVGANSQFDAYKIGGYATRDLARNTMVATGFHASWENECMIIDAEYYRRYTSLAGDSGATAMMIEITFKTVGQFGFKAF